MEPHLSHGVGQDVDDLLMWRCHHALAVDLNDVVTHPYPAPLSDAPAHKAADLWKDMFIVSPQQLQTQRIHTFTHNAVLHTEAQLEAKGRPSD